MKLYKFKAFKIYKFLLLPYIKLIANCDFFFINFNSDFLTCSVGDQYQNILSAAFFRLKMVDPDIEASSHMEINPSQNSTIIADGPTQTGLSLFC